MPSKTRNPVRSVALGKLQDRSTSLAEYAVAVRLGAPGAVVSLVPSTAVVNVIWAGKLCLPDASSAVTPKE